MEDPLSKALSLAPLPDRELREVIVPENPTDDYEVARRNVHRLIARTDDAIDELGEIAFVSQHARAYEVLAGLIKTGIEANRELMELRKRERDLAGEDAKVVSGDRVMTTAELLEELKSEK